MPDVDHEMCALKVRILMSLTDDDLIRIMDLLVDQVNVNLVAKQIKIHLTSEASRYILEKTCADRNYGARPLRRALQKYVEDPLSEAVIQGSLPRPSELEIYLGDSGIYCRPISGEPVEQPVGAGVGAGVAIDKPSGTPLYMF